MDLLITLHRKLQRTVDILGVRPIAQKVFRRLYAKRYAGNRLARVTQNGREWWLDPQIGLRGELQEFDTVAWLQKVIRPGMTVLDVGANVGQMTLEMAHLAGPTGNIVAIEPAPGNLELLDRHVKGNGFEKRVIIIKAACAENHGGTAEFKFIGTSSSAVGSGHSLILDKALTESEKRFQSTTSLVPLVSIDGLCAERTLRPQVIKIDVEGAELLVLKGAKQTLRSARPELRFGFHPFAFKDPEGASAEIRDLLRDLDYEITGDNGNASFGLNEYSAIPRKATSRS